VTDERRDDWPSVAAATDSNTLGAGGPHTHPVSAPHTFVPESGTPVFSKGRARHEQRPDAAVPAGEARAGPPGAPAPTRGALPRAP
jgi:hypothetical protein